MKKSELVRKLESITGEENVLTSPEDMVCYSYDGAYGQIEQEPVAVVSPKTTHMVSEIMKLANQEGIPVVPRGAGTSVTGASVPVAGGIVLNTTLMNKILEIDEGNRIAVVQPGVVLAELQAEVERLGLFYPPDPVSWRQCTIGGNVGTSAKGPRGLKYGTTKDYVLGLEVVLSSGEIIHVGGRVGKNVTGYNLTQLFVGSEGTLGVFTEIILQLIPQPQARGVVMAAFPNLETAVTAITNILLAGIPPVSCELLDKVTIGAIEANLHAGLPTEAEVIIISEVDGDSEVVARDCERLVSTCQEAGALLVSPGTTSEDIARLMTIRGAAGASHGSLGRNKVTEDPTVPLLAIPEMVRRIQQVASKYNLLIAVLGHIGDGNLHPCILFDQTKQEEVEHVRQALRDICLAAIELGGALTGEHGVGLLKKEYLGAALEPEVIAKMRLIKQVFDPKNILNPGKIFP